MCVRDEIEDQGAGCQGGQGERGGVLRNAQCVYKAHQWVCQGYGQCWQAKTRNLLQQAPSPRPQLAVFGRCKGWAIVVQGSGPMQYIAAWYSMPRWCTHASWDVSWMAVIYQPCSTPQPRGTIYRVTHWYKHSIMIHIHHCCRKTTLVARPAGQGGHCTKLLGPIAEQCLARSTTRHRLTYGING